MKKKEKSITLGGYLKATLLVVIPATVIISIISGKIMRLEPDRLLINVICNFVLGVMLVLLVSTKNYIRYMIPSLKIINTLRSIVRESDLSKRMSDDIKGEMGDVREYFNQFIGKIQDIMASINETTFTLNKSSKELLVAAKSMTLSSSETNLKTDAVNATS